MSEPLGMESPMEELCLSQSLISEPLAMEPIFLEPSVTVPHTVTVSEGLLSGQPMTEINTLSHLKDRNPYSLHHDDKIVKNSDNETSPRNPVFYQRSAISFLDGDGLIDPARTVKETSNITESDGDKNVPKVIEILPREEYQESKEDSCRENLKGNHYKLFDHKSPTSFEGEQVDAPMSVHEDYNNTETNGEGNMFKVIEIMPRGKYEYSKEDLCIENMSGSKWEFFDHKSSDSFVSNLDKNGLPDRKMTVNEEPIKTEINHDKNMSKVTEIESNKKYQCSREDASLQNTNRNLEFKGDDFGMQTALTEHEKSGVDAKNSQYSCKLCKAEFDQEDWLHHHMQLHEKRPVAKCPYCSWHFSWDGTGSLHEAFKEHRKSCSEKGKGQDSIERAQKVGKHRSENKRRTYRKYKRSDPFSNLQRAIEQDENGEFLINKNELCSKIPARKDILLDATELIHSLQAQEIKLNIERQALLGRRSALTARFKDLSGRNLLNSLSKSYIGCSYPVVRLLDVSKVLKFKIQYSDMNMRNNVGQCSTTESITRVDKCGHWVIGNDSKLTLHKMKCGKQKHSKNKLCKFCGKSFTTTSNLNTHINAIHRKLKPFSCTLCDMSFAAKGDRVRHRNAVHYKLKPFSCTLCDKSFAESGQLTAHTNSVHHKLRPQQVSCTLCNRLFSCKKSLTNHIVAIHHKMKPFSCTLCDKSFAEKGTLITHVRSVHDKVKSFTCRFCHKTFAQRAHLTGHVNAIHLKLTPFSCTLCDKSFAYRNILNEHIDVFHHKIKRFPCTFCDKSWPNKSDLNKHVAAVHHKLKPFSCTLCDKSFAQKGGLTSHVNAVHGKLKPFSCTLCEKSFGQRSQMTTHINSIHRKCKPFSCTFCDKCFAEKGNLKQHVNSMHQNKSVVIPK